MCRGNKIAYADIDFVHLMKIHILVCSLRWFFDNSSLKECCTKGHTVTTNKRINEQ